MMTRTREEHLAHRRAYDVHRRRQRAYGRWNPYVDGDLCRAHLAHLSQHGMGMQAVSDATGISVATLQRLKMGRPTVGVPPTPRVLRHTAERLLALTPQPLPGATLRAIGASRRVQALAALGWSYPVLAARLHITPEAVQRLSKRETVTYAVLCRLRDLYEEIGDTQGGSLITARRAARLGYVPPIWWDDEGIDDPDWWPRSELTDLEDTASFLPLEVRAAELPTTDALLVLVQGGYTAREAGQRYGLSQHAVQKRLDRRREQVAS